MQTPGVSARWVAENLAGNGRRQDYMRRHFPQAIALGRENAFTATYDDARRYMERAEKYSDIPVWAYPYYLEDLKAGKMSKAQVARIWGYRKPRDILSWETSNVVFHSRKNN
jgi:hypothetical protein